MADDLTKGDSAATKRERDAALNELREALDHFDAEAILSLVRPGRLSEWKGQFRMVRVALLELLDQLEAAQGNVYLWRIGEIDAEKAMEGVRDALGL